MLALYEPGDEAAWLASFRFFVELRPRYCECDGQGHVSNVIYPAYLEFSRLQYFVTVGDPDFVPGPGRFAFQHVTAELRLRYLGACFYDEPLRIYSKLVALGKSSATMDQVLLGNDGTIRAIARMAIVRSRDDRTEPWSSAQRAALEALEGRLPAATSA